MLFLQIEKVGRWRKIIAHKRHGNSAANAHKTHATHRSECLMLMGIKIDAAGRSAGTVAQWKIILNGEKGNKTASASRSSGKNMRGV